MDRDLLLDPAVPSPCYVVSEELIRRNLAVLDRVQRATGVKILLALKGFAMFSLFPVIREVLHGVAASSVDEARLGWEEFGKAVHTCAPAYPDADMPELIRYSDHIVFNSFPQWKRFRRPIREASKRVRVGIRINPQHSEVKVPIYDPCGPGSRLGVVRSRFEPESLDGVTGLHFHTLCELNADSLERTLAVVEERFGDWFGRMEWINFGGGHHITRPDYDVDRLCRLLQDFQSRHALEVFLEPGEAIALNTGFLVATVLDVVENDLHIAVLDTSAAAHMPDVLEMPYRPEVIGAEKPGVLPFTYRLAGMTCLAGDVIGEYSFERPLSVGDRLVFLDMAHYTMVKNNTFNGIRLPSIGILDQDGRFRLVKRFGYADYRNRLS
ncbi:MAG: carboxynorspermidine decarboxylase [Thermodesulfobacteriota bacterium]